MTLGVLLLALAVLPMRLNVTQLRGYEISQLIGRKRERARLLRRYHRFLSLLSVSVSITPPYCVAVQLKFIYTNDHLAPAKHPKTKVSFFMQRFCIIIFYFPRTLRIERFLRSYLGIRWKFACNNITTFRNIVSESWAGASQVPGEQLRVNI